ncbi:MAG TPA: formyltetrahydrofolate deformylase [Thermoleophilaceae bacterium]|jgi:formyltetrahydrofolate deformylase|nr:formyltetrahydrofolate deformylase [Thermoleophilaceae bacterium]
MEARDTGCLLVRCDDRPGIVAAISQFLFERGANITHSDQHSTDPSGGRFFLRMVFHLPQLDELSASVEQDFRRGVAERLELDWSLSRRGRRKRIALMVSREDHCLLDLLWRHRRGELEAEVGAVISNHPDLGEAVGQFAIPFHHIPVTPELKREAEARQLELLAGNYDLVVLARYMQILSGEFLARLGCPVINIHHSFLPAFAGPDPYARAKARGVKVIGATAHYVTERLDEGPIIDQDVIRVSHRDDVAQMIRLGRDVERTTLARAVQWHLEDRVLIDGDTTVVFR